MGSEGLPFARAGNINGGFLFDDADLLDQDNVPKAGEKVSRPDDIVFTSKGTVGRFAFVRAQTPRFVYSPQLCFWRVLDLSVVEPRFLFYWMQSAEFLDQVQSVKGLTDMADYVSLSDQRRMLLTAPPLPVQRRIASILSAYDDLIENNARRIKILEEMAQMLYREWFVNFRFPGHEKVRMVESELGPIPEGWTAKCVTDAVNVNPSTKVPKEGTKPFVPMGSLSDGSMLITSVEEREGNSGSKFKNGDTLFARITPCLENGKTGFIQFLSSDDAVAFGSTEFIVLRSKTVCPEYVYLMARSNEFRDNAIKSMSGATGRQRVQEACFGRFFLAEPDGTTLARFREAVTPMFRLIHSLSTKNANLRTTRDLLLPKLISGEIPVEASDETAAELAEQTA
ncbi:MAG: restriction endonuclease subunit S [Bryobacterales bacterium]|nr:restriction endonuclease subunit S [Bryobacterales bacterium]